MERVVIILNPEATNLRRFNNKKKEILKILSEYYDVYLWETIKQGDGIRLAEKAIDFGAKLIISAGGDGTLNEVVNVCAGKDVKIGILPIGITNVFALSQGISMNIMKALDVIIKGKVCEFDLGIVRKDNKIRYFHMVFGAGLDGFVVHQIPLEFKKAFGATAHIVMGLVRYPVYEPKPMDVEIDGIYYGKCYQIMVSNIPNYGGHMKIAPEANPSDGILDVVIFREGGFLSDVSYFFGIMLGIHPNYDSVEIHKGKKIKIEGDAFYHLDSEPCGKTPVYIECKSKCVKIIVP